MPKRRAPKNTAASKNTASLPKTMARRQAGAELETRTGREPSRRDQNRAGRALGTKCAVLMCGRECASWQPLTPRRGFLRCSGRQSSAFLLQLRALVRSSR
jgi:hypothetical protein